MVPCILPFTAFDILLDQIKAHVRNLIRQRLDADQFEPGKSSVPYAGRVKTK